MRGKHGVFPCAAFEILRLQLAWMQAGRDAQAPAYGDEQNVERYVIPVHQLVRADRIAFALQVLKVFPHSVSVFQLADKHRRIGLDRRGIDRKRLLEKALIRHDHFVQHARTKHV